MPQPQPRHPNRRLFNDLAVSVRIEELRALRSQLTTMIQDNVADGGSASPGGSADESARSAASLSALGRGDEAERASARVSSPRRHRRARHRRDDSCGSCDSSDSYDIESGGDALTASRLSLVDEEPLPATHRTGTLRSSSDSAVLNLTEQTSDNRNGLDETTSTSTDPTLSTLSTCSCQKRWKEPSKGRGLLSFYALGRRNGGRRSSKSLRSKLDASMRSTKSLRSKLDVNVHTFRRLPNYDFLRKDDEGKEEGSLLPGAGAKWWHAVFGFSFVSLLACVGTLWAPYPVGARMPSAMVAETPWSNGCQGLQSCICPRETMCADDLVSMVFLTIARSTAWFDYPLYMLLFLSKAHNLNNFLQRTALRCWINFSDFHRVHALFGAVVGIESASHSFFHLLRWARRRDDLRLLWTTRTGITGLIAVLLVPFIALPMTVPWLKKRMSYEWRKGLHYLSVLWGAALMCHAPQRIFYLVGVPLLVYVADKLAEGLFKTHLVESAHFQRLGESSCLVSFANPPGFGTQNSAYVYLMLPWLSKYQFHAFTVFPSVTPGHSSLCIDRAGDWTTRLMDAVTNPTHKPAFVVGPFLSPFSSPAMDSENLLAVASGIGVTPAISLIRQYSHTSRRLNLVWICRDPALVEHFLQNVEFGSDGYTLIYYTGKERALILRDDLPPNVLIFNGRPDLERTLGGIIASIATGEGLPEELHKKVLTRTPAQMRSKLLLEKALSIYSTAQLYEYTVKASRHHERDPELPAATASYQGVLSTMKHLLGEDGALVHDKIAQNFDLADADGDGSLDPDEFAEFFHLMLDKKEELSSSMVQIKRGLQQMTTCRDLFANDRPATPRSDPSADDFGIKGHLQGEGKFAARNWNMLYCGGSQPVVDQLKAFKRKFGIGLSVEKFDW